MINESQTQNVSPETLAKQKFLSSLSVISRAYKKAAESDDLLLISKYTAKSRGDNLRKVHDDLAAPTDIYNPQSAQGNLFTKAGNLLGGALDNLGVEILKEAGISKETLEKHVENIVSSAKTLGYDISGSVSPFLEQLEANDQMENQNDDFPCVKVEP